jgi:hypothetical protein
LSHSTTTSFVCCFTPKQTFHTIHPPGNLSLAPKIEWAISEYLQEQNARIIIPAPVVSEFLTYASADYLAEINASKHFEVGAFDQRAAIEAAATLKKALKSGQGKKLGMEGNWQKIKIDRQIVAIAKVYGVSMIYTTDQHIPTLAADSGLTTTHVANLPLPPSKSPLFDLPATDVSTGPEPPSGRSPGAETPTVSVPEQGPRAIPPRDPAPQQPDSSPPAAQPPRSKQ